MRYVISKLLGSPQIHLIFAFQETSNQIRKTFSVEKKLVEKQKLPSYHNFSSSNSLFLNRLYQHK